MNANLKWTGRCAALAILLSTSASVFAADYAGAETRKGSSKGEACEKAKTSAALSARAAGFSTNTISLGGCDCDKVDDSRFLNWECTVSWEASKKGR